MKAFIIFFALICFSLTTCYAAGLNEDVDAFAKDSPQGFVNFCWSAAGFYQQAGNFQKALDWADRILKAQPKNYQMQFYKAQLLFALNKDSDCQKLLEAIENTAELKDTPLLVSGRGLLYESYKRKGSLKNKEKELEGKLKAPLLGQAKKVELDTYQRLFVMYRVSMSFDKTVELAKKAKEAYPGESSFILASAYAYDRKSKNKEALNEYKAYDKKFPNNLAVLSRIVDLEIASGLFDEASAKLNEIEKTFFANPQILAQAKNYRDLIARSKQKQKK